VVQGISDVVYHGLFTWPPCGGQARERKIEVQGRERRGWLLNQITHEGNRSCPGAEDALEVRSSERPQQKQWTAWGASSARRYFGLEGGTLRQRAPGPDDGGLEPLRRDDDPRRLGFLIAWYRRPFGDQAPDSSDGPRIILSNRFTGVYFAKRGVLRGGRNIALRTLRDARHDTHGHARGDRDTWRPYTKRYEVCFGGRSDYARLAILAGVPIVPVANASAHGLLIVLTDGRPFARGPNRPAPNSLAPRFSRCTSRSRGAARERGLTCLRR
jgi:hypothetical protein